MHCTQLDIISQEGVPTSYNGRRHKLISLLQTMLQNISCIRLRPALEVYTICRVSCQNKCVDSKIYYKHENDRIHVTAFLKQSLYCIYIRPRTAVFNNCQIYLTIYRWSYLLFYKLYIHIYLNKFNMLRKGLQMFS